MSIGIWSKKSPEVPEVHRMGRTHVARFCEGYKTGTPPVIPKKMDFHVAWCKNDFEESDSVISAFI